MNENKILQLTMVSLLMFQCSVSNREDPAFVEAARIHNEAVALAEQLEDHLANDTISLKDSLILWQEAIKKWESNLVEVPGNESNDHSTHDHHQGKQIPELTPEQMLSVQKELKLELDVIKLRINAIHP